MYEVYVGGTFNILHRGHRKLLEMAADHTAHGFRELVIGVTTDQYAQSTRSLRVRPYERRARDAKAYAESLTDSMGDSLIGYSEAHIVPISGHELPETIDETDVIVCSNETLERVVQQLKGIPLESRPLVRVIPLEPKRTGDEGKMSSTEQIQDLLKKSEFDMKISEIEEYDGDMVGLMYGIRDRLSASPFQLEKVQTEEKKWRVR